MVLNGHQSTDLSDYSNTGIGQAKCHGYAVAKDNSEPLTPWVNFLPWGPENNGLTIEPDYPREEGESDNEYLLRDWSGFSHTSRIIEAAGDDIKDYQAVYVVTRESAPSNSSGWFLPSVGQLKTAYLMPQEMIIRASGNEYAALLPYKGYYTSNVSNGDPYIIMGKIGKDIGQLCYRDHPVKPIEVVIYKYRGMLAF